LGTKERRCQELVLACDLDPRGREVEDGAGVDDEPGHRVPPIGRVRTLLPESCSDGRLPAVRPRVRGKTYDPTTDFRSVDSQPSAEAGTGAVADNLGTMMTAANAMNAASAVRSRSIVACAVCGVHQVHAPGDRIIRAHRRRQWSFECKGSGRRGIELGFADWFRNARSGALILVGGDPNTSEAIVCRSCRRVFDV